MYFVINPLIFRYGKMVRTRCATLLEARPGSVCHTPLGLTKMYTRTVYYVLSTDSRHLLDPYFAALNSILQFAASLLPSMYLLLCISCQL